MTNLKNKKIGFIGCGKMASAIISGITSAKLTETNNITASEINQDFARIKSEELSIKVLCNNNEVAKNSDIIFIATKPSQVVNVLETLELNETKLIVSIAAGVKISNIEKYTQKAPVIRVMPNAPLTVQEGMSAIVKGTFAKEEDVLIVKEILESLGKCIVTYESQIDIVTAISGSGPAFFYKIIHEMALAGEKLGMSYQDALLLAEQTALGSAKLMMNSKLTPTELIENISTKGGCTEVGVSVMNNADTETLMNEVILKTKEKAEALGN